VPHHVEIEKPPNHLLILRSMLLGFSLEEFDAGFAQTNGDFGRFLLEGEFFRRRKEIVDHPDIAQGLVGIFSSLFCCFLHRSFSPSSNNPLL
jgi:hypothetical protein